MVLLQFLPVCPCDLADLQREGGEIAKLQVK